jgi:hypothetical protein
MTNKSINPTSILAVLLFTVMAFLLSAMPVSAKVALGSSGFSSSVELEKIDSNALTLLEKSLSYRLAVLGNSNVPVDNPNGNTLLESGRCSGVFCNGEQVPDVDQDVDVEFSFTRNQSRHDADEFVDQGFDQGAGLSNRTSGEALDTIDDFDLNGRPPEASTAIRNFRDENPDLDLSGQDVLHRTDVCVGGDPSCISGGGASGINRSLGVQNNNQRDSIREQLESISSDTNPTVRVIIENNAGD